MERISLNHRKLPTIYFPPKFHNLLAIHLLGALSYDPDSKYLTSGFQQGFGSSPGACLVYQLHSAFYAYLSDMVIMSVILDTVSTIDSVIPDHFHHPICMDPDSPLFISPYNIISIITISHIYPLPSFLQCCKHSKRGSFYALILPELSHNCANFCSKAQHYLNAILTNLGGVDLVSRFLSADTIYELSQYYFDMKNGGGIKTCQNN